MKYEREQLVTKLGNKLKTSGIDGALIFDSYYQIGPRERFFQAGIDVHYTDEKQTADDYILEWLRLAKRPQDYTVVTSDRSLARRAAGKGAMVQTAEAFRLMLQRIYLKKLRSPKVMKPLPSIVKVSPTHVETNEERYERIFEEKLQGDTPLIKITKEKKLYLNPKKEEEQKEEDDFERWLKIFEYKPKV